MKLVSLALKDFLAHENLEIRFGAKTLITGPNHVGKTSIRDGVKFALTGIARGLPKKNMALALGRDGKKPRASLTLDAEANGKQFSVDRSPTTCNMTPSALSALGLSEELCHILTDPYRFIDGLEPTERQAIVTGLLATKKVDLASAFECPNGSNDADLMKILVEAADDVEAAYKRAYAARTECGRLVKAAKEQATVQVGTKVMTSKGEKDVTIPGHAVEKVTPFLEKLEAEAREYERSIEGAELIVDHVAKAEFEANAKKISAAKANKPGDARKELLERNAQLVARQQQINYTRSGLQREDQVLRDQNRQIAAKIEAIKTGKTTCAICGANATCSNHGAHELMVAANKAASKDLKVRHEEIEEELAALDGETAEIDQKLAALDEKITKASVPQVDVTALERRQEQIKKDLESLATFVKYECTSGDAASDNKGRLPAGEGRLAQYKQRIQDGHTILAARKLWDASRTGLETAQEAIKQHDAEYEAWGRLCEFLGPDGQARTLVASSVESATFPEDLAAAWGRTFKVEADGSVTFNGRPVELASMSERLEAGIMFQAWIARKTLGWLVCDEVDKLFGDDKRGFNAWFAHEQELQIVAIASAEAAPAKIPEWLTFVWLGEKKEVTANG
jgi:DNA repair exonuclease SbcCD ATPase subunit